MSDTLKTAARRMLAMLAAPLAVACGSAPTPAAQTPSPEADRKAVLAQELGEAPAPSGPIPVQQLQAPAQAAQAMTDRNALVEACIWMRDRATSPALAQHLDGAFAKVGVSQVDATGQRFDPAVHEAGSTIAAGSPAEDGIIARTEQIGYTDRGRLLRHPIVTVYRGQVRA